MKNEPMAEIHGDEGGFLRRSDMTLRDYFAGQALAGTGNVNYHTIKEMAETCYKIADAMLEARK